MTTHRAPWRPVLTLIAAASLAASTGVDARVTKITVTSTTPLFNGQSFGAGAYSRSRARRRGNSTRPIDATR